MDSEQTNMFEEFKAQQSEWDSVHSSQKYIEQIVDQSSPLSGEQDYAEKSYDQAMHKDEESTGPNKENSEQDEPQPVKMPKEKLGSLKKRNLDYEKNICGYISKSCVLEFVDPKGKKRVEYYCQKQRCSYEDAISYYKVMSVKVFGVGLLGELLIPESQAEVGIKRAFYQFMIWFLRHRYPLYVIRNGKMEDKAFYLEYKSKYILYFESVMVKIL